MPATDEEIQRLLNTGGATAIAQAHAHAAHRQALALEEIARQLLKIATPDLSLVGTPHPPFPPVPEDFAHRGGGLDVGQPGEE